MGRYFKCSVIAGRLLVQEPLNYWTVEQLGRFAPMAAAEKRIRTVEEFDAALQSDHRPLTLWLVEGMEEEARRRVRG